MNCQTARLSNLILRTFLLWASLQSGNCLASGKEEESIYGTYGVTFQPVQAGGELIGCSLLYKAAHADHAYLNGRAVVILGNISVHQFGGELLFGLKIGVQEALGNHSIVRPNFAYLQTKSKSTAKVKQKANDGDEGYRLFVYSLYDPTVLALFDEMKASGKVTVAFNRRKNGVDVMVPVDLEVIDVEYLSDARVVRKRSRETASNFHNCFGKLIDQAKTSLNKK